MHLVPLKHLKVKYMTWTCVFSILQSVWRAFACGLLICFVSWSSTAIGNAYAVLSNPEKRRQYDVYGEEKAHPTHRNRTHHRNFEADISPEDLFNMFFGGGFPTSESCDLFKCGFRNMSVVVFKYSQNREMCRCAISFFMLLGNVHVYSNGRMRFGHQPRHERQEQQREVRAQSSCKIIRGFVRMFYL